MDKVKAFIIDYIERHHHPLNACLHIVGVPCAFFGIFKFCTGTFLEGSLEIVFGYFLQYLGHRIQGNEVGEVTLIKHVWASLKGDQ